MMAITAMIAATPEDHNGHDGRYEQESRYRSREGETTRLEDLSTGIAPAPSPTTIRPTQTTGAAMMAMAAMMAN